MSGVPCKRGPGPCTHDIVHGTIGAYSNHACRCAECRAANTACNLAGRQRRHAAMIAGEVLPPHGVESTYMNYMCRCQPCRDDHNRRDHIRRDRQREREQ